MERIVLNSQSVELNYRSILAGKLDGTELVLGLVGAVGADLSSIERVLDDCLDTYGYSIEVIRVSKLIGRITEVPQTTGDNEFERITTLMTAGDRARKESKKNEILALAAVAGIYSWRNLGEESGGPRPRKCYIINSLKHPDEVNALRRIYGNGFILIGVFVAHEQRKCNLIHKKNMSPSQAAKLIARDEEEGLEEGQRTRATFHLSDVFIDAKTDAIASASLKRALEIIFGNPHRTPVFDEFAMFMAFAAATRSADLSRQIGAVLANDDEVLATGVNECPRAGGGTYWPVRLPNGEIRDTPDGRDYVRGVDSNDLEKRELVSRTIDRVKTAWKNAGKSESDLDEELLRKAIGAGPIDDITEYGRVVHAEMNALLTCARHGIRTVGAALFTTTFPCHNCAKHIIASGVKRVVYIEPYPKSKAMKFHEDSAFIGSPGEEDDNKVIFEPFVGIGPRRFFDLFSMRHGSGYPLQRKSNDGTALLWDFDDGTIRTPMLPWNYLQREEIAASMAEPHIKGDSHEQRAGEKSEAD